MGENVALSRTVGSVLMIPMQFGPMRRIPAERIRSTSASSSARPRAPVSLKPAEIITRALTPLAMQSSTTSSACAAGTTTTARSTSPGIAETLGNASTPSMGFASGLTGTTVP
jgi:hypothetical protein